MSSTPKRFIALMTKNQLTEMLAPTYGSISSIDPNDAYRRLESSLKQIDLILAVQDTLWDSVRAKKPDIDEGQLLDLIGKKVSKPRKWRAPTVPTKDEGAWVAVGLYFDLFAGVASGEAADLLETDSGRDLLDRGFGLLGDHLAKELLR